MTVNKFFFFLAWALFTCTLATGQTKGPEKKSSKNKPQGKEEKVIEYNEDFEKAAELFQLNKPEEAIPLFEKAIEAENVNPLIYVYMGVAYYQMEDYTKSMAICVKGLAREDTDHKVLAYNAGNSAYSMANYIRADSLYAIALKEDPNYAPAILNRANAQLKLDHLEDSKNSYIKYLEIDPETPQKPVILQVIALLEEEIARRAREKPELVTPDELPGNEKMEMPVPGEIVSETPPQAPVEPVMTTSGEKVNASDAIAPALPAGSYTAPRPASKSTGEQVKEESIAPAVPASDTEKAADKKGQSEKAAEEQIKDLELPAMEGVYTPPKTNEEYKMEKIKDPSAPPPASEQKRPVQEFKEPEINDMPLPADDVIDVKTSTMDAK